MNPRLRIVSFIIALTGFFLLAWFTSHSFSNPPTTLVVESENHSQIQLDLSTLTGATAIPFVSHANAYQEGEQKPLSARALPFEKVLSALSLKAEHLWIEIESGNGFKSYVDSDYIQRFKPILYFEIEGHPIDNNQAHYGAFPMGPFLFYPTDLSSRKSFAGNPEEVFYQWNVVKIRIFPEGEAANYQSRLIESQASYFALSFCIHCHADGNWGGHLSSLGFSELKQEALSRPQACIDSIDHPDRPENRARMEQRSYWSQDLKKDVCQYLSRWKSP